MTYCLGLYLHDGLVLMSDSRTNAGVDQIALVRKMAFFSNPGERVIGICSAGNLATTQAVITLLEQRVQDGTPPHMLSCATLFDAAQLLGDTLREVIARDGQAVSAYGDPSASFLLAGQIAGEPHRVFQVYSAGNFIEASAETCFVQIGETKYGKPILDRLVTPAIGLADAAKCALLSMDATIRSNLSVAPPVDLWVCPADSLSVDQHRRFDDDDPYWQALRQTYSDGLCGLFEDLPEPDWITNASG